MGKEPRICPRRVGVTNITRRLTYYQNHSDDSTARSLDFCVILGYLRVSSMMDIATYDGSPRFGVPGGQDWEKVVGKDDCCSHNVETPDGFGGSSGCWAVVHLGLWCCIAGFGV